MRPVGKTEFVENVARQAKQRGVKTRVCAGIVGYADLELSDEVDAVLQAHINAAGGRFRGVHPILARHDAFNVTLPSPAPAGLKQRAAGTLNIMPVQLASQSGADLDSFQDSHPDGEGVVEFEALMRKLDRIDGSYRH